MKSWSLIVRAGLTAVLVVSSVPASAQQACSVVQTGIFPGENAATREEVRLIRTPGGTGRVGVFSARLAVNTDGAPTSYHPDDLLGQTLALNRMNNGVTISRNGVELRCGLGNCEEFSRLFGIWKSARFAVPSTVAGLEGVTIGWTSVIAPNAAGRPCVFQSGPYQGYFGSMTALGNGLPDSQAGECLFNNQLDLREVPAIVLRGRSATENPLFGYGVRTGDLAIAINPATGVVVPAIVGDTGNNKRIGEGSIALNMALLGRTVQPRNYAETAGLDTGRQSIIVASIPGSRQFERVRPYTADSIRQRVGSWLRASGYADLATFSDHMRRCAAGL